MYYVGITYVLNYIMCKYRLNIYNNTHNNICQTHCTHFGMYCNLCQKKANHVLACQCIMFVFGMYEIMICANTDQIHVFFSICANTQSLCECISLLYSIFTLVWLDNRISAKRSIASILIHIQAKGTTKAVIEWQSLHVRFGILHCLYLMFTWDFQHFIINKTGCCARQSLRDTKGTITSGGTWDWLNVEKIEAFALFAVSNCLHEL